jgi:UDP-glucose 4-epimerase
MKIFITGGTGNIGQYVTKALSDAGHTCIVYTRTPERVPGISLLPNVTQVQGDLSEFEKMEAALQGCDAVIHNALGWGNEPLSMLDKDTRVSVFLMETAEKAGVGQFIYTSSTSAIGYSWEGDTDETTPRKPGDLYGSTKAATELYLLGFRQFYASQGGYGTSVKMRRNIIRPGYTFSNPAFEGGASQPDRRFFNIAKAVLANENVIFSKSDGTQFISSGQIAQLYLKLVESDHNEEIIHALGNRYTTWGEIAQMALEMTPQSTSKVILEPDDWTLYRYKVDKMERLFGLSFDATDELREHMRWNLDRARRALAGEELYSVTHEYSDE